MGGGIDDLINHVEYWSNRDDTRFVYEMNESGAEYSLTVLLYCQLVNKPYNDRINMIYDIYRQWY